MLGKLAARLAPPQPQLRGSFDLAVSLFSGEPADPPSDDFIMRNAMDAVPSRTAPPAGARPPH